MEKKSLIVGGVALVIGLIIGCIVCCMFMMGKMNMNDNRSSMNGMHMMPNGQMMSNDGSSMDMSMSAMMDQMNAELKGKTGDAFDQAFLSEMIVHHEGAVGMAESALTNAKHPELKKLAQDIITAQNKEIAEMKQWQKNWYNQQ